MTYLPDLYKFNFINNVDINSNHGSLNSTDIIRIIMQVPIIRLIIH
jgi:hypothetical protein